MEFITCAEAKAKGLKHYFTGKPCKNGHTSERLTGARTCVDCRKEYAPAYYQENRESALARDKNYYAENRADILERQHKRAISNPGVRAATSRRYRERNPETVAGIMRRNYLKNRDTVLVRQRERHLEHPEKATAKVALRRSRKQLAVPPWFDELDQFVWQEAAHLARLRRDATGIEWAADHMIPLAAKNACGLHVATNCQVIPSYLNLHKHNKLIMTEPFDWISHL